jgi:hypothetical protein
MDMHGNTVGSRGSLTVQQKAILIGKILGDGCLEKNGNHVRLKVEHGLKQKEYVNWLFSAFKPFVGKSPYSISHRGLEKNATLRWRFSTKTNAVFDDYYQMFYPNRKKIVPQGIQKLINNPLTLAIWYMDDGYLRTGHSGAYLCTSSFSSSENEELTKALFNVYGIETCIHYARKYPRIHIPSRHLQKFKKLIQPFVLKSFIYKLPLTP